MIVDAELENIAHKHGRTTIHVHIGPHEANIYEYINQGLNE